MSRGLAFRFASDTAGLEAGLKKAAGSFDNLKDQAQQADRALRSIPNNVEVDLDLKSLTGIRARLEAQRRQIQEQVSDIEVDLDVGKAIRDLNKIEREIRKIDRMEANVDINIDKDGGGIGKIGQLAGSLGQLGTTLASGSLKGGPYVMAGIAAGAAAIGAVVTGPVVGGMVAFAGALGGFKLLEEFGKYEADVRKFNTVFGDTAPIMEDWVKTIPSEASIRDLKGFAAGVQDLLVPQGFSRSDAAGITKDIVERGVALAKWSGKDTATGIEAVTGALLGEREQLQGLGVAISQSEIEDWIKNNASAVEGLTDAQAQTVATLELIEQKSGDAWTAYTSGATTAQGAIDGIKSSLANFKDTVIAEFGGIATEILSGFDMSGIQNPLEGLTSWIKENKATIKNLMIDIGTAVLTGADAVLAFAKMVITAFSSAWPVISGFIDAVTWAWQGLLLAMANTPFAKMLGIDDDLRDAAASAGELSDNIQNIGNDFVDMSDDAVAGIDSARGSLSNLKGQLLDMKDTKLELGVTLERDGLYAARTEIRNLSEEQLVSLAVGIDPATASATDVELRNLALDRMVEMNPELVDRAGAEAALADLAADRDARITARADTLKAEGALTQAQRDRVTQLIAQGKTAEAERLLNDAARSRSSNLNVSVSNYQYTENTLAFLARQRTATITVNAATGQGWSRLPGLGGGGAVIRSIQPGEGYPQQNIRIMVDGRELSYVVERSMDRSRSAQSLTNLMAKVA